jgi:hypothetical protein
MRLFPRHAVAALVLIAAAACIDITHPDYSIKSHSFTAYTNLATASDSLQCVLFASLPMADSIQVPWTGTATIQLRRSRKTSNGFITADTIVTAATFDLTRGVGDSLSVKVSGAFSVVFQGRIPQKYDAYGTWQCDDRVPLSRQVPGEAFGTWTLSAVRPID